MARIERRYSEKNRNVQTGGSFRQRPPYTWHLPPTVPRPPRFTRVKMLRKPRLPFLPIR